MTEVYNKMDISIRKNMDVKVSTNTVSVISASSRDLIDKLNTELRTVVMNEFGDELTGKDYASNTDLSNRIKRKITSYLNDSSYRFDTTQTNMDVINDFIVNFSGYGILQPLIDNQKIEEIIILKYDEVYYSTGKGWILSDIKFANDSRMRSFVDNLLAPVNKQINRKTPIVDARLSDGSRVSISDASISGGESMTFNIRKFPVDTMKTHNLVNYKTISKDMESFLIKAMGGYLNIIVSGGTSSGKTTILNALAQHIDKSDFVVSMEDNLEIQLDRNLWLPLESRPANVEGVGAITTADLQIHSLRRSPGRIIVGEIREPSSADAFLNAINTGHDGLMCTIHANNPLACQKRISKLVSAHNKQDISQAMDDFNNSCDLIIQIKNHKELSRRIVTHITYVANNGELYDIFKYNKKTNLWETNNIPKELIEKMEYNS